MNTEELIKELIEEQKEKFFEPQEVLDQICNPLWEIYDKFHNWRNYVPRYLQLNWSKLSKQTKIVIWFLCEKQANNEEWD